LEVLVHRVLTLVGVVETEDRGVIVQGHSRSSCVILPEIGVKEILLGVSKFTASPRI
jgi:hypothetical protein